MLEPLQEEIRTLHAILGSERDPDGRAFAPLADAYRRAGEPRKAFGLLTDGLARLPDFVSGHVVAAKLYGEQGLFEEGEMAARKALELDPENVGAMAALVALLERAGRPEEAAEVRETLMTLEPEVLAEEGLVPDDPVAEVEIAPDEPVLEDEAVVDVTDLAPDDAPSAPVEAAAGAELADVIPDEPVLDLADLAPTEPATEASTPTSMPLTDESVSELEGLGSEEEIMDIGAFAPDALDDAPDEDVVDIGAFAPDDPLDQPILEDESVVDVTDLAPDPPASEPARPAGAGQPVARANPGADAVDDPRPSPNPDGEESKEGAPRIYTRTLGELYAQQGFLDRAVEVFRQLRAENPDDDGLASRLGELEAQAAGGAVDTPPEAATAEPTRAVDGARGDDGALEDAEGERARTQRHDDELEALAQDLVGHGESPGEAVDTPFAWADHEADPDEDAHEATSPDDERSIERYFEDLLSWQPTRRS